MQNAIKLLEPSGSNWPVELSQIPSPPERLWARGSLEILRQQPRVAIVGSRSPTPYGVAQAVRFARGLAAQGICVVSGMARGVDQAAHGAALDAGGCSLAVLGGGVDRPWPACDLAERLIREGLLLSEFAPGQRPRRHHFPLRNRIISGLSHAVIVVEAAHHSGSLITAHWAADQGRQVFAIPGRVDHPMARGSHRLIREGATLVESPEDVLRELRANGLTLPFPPSISAPPRSHTSPISRALEGETLCVDELAEHLSMEIPALLSELTTLELAGVVIRSPGGLYRLAT